MNQSDRSLASTLLSSLNAIGATAPKVIAAHARATKTSVAAQSLGFHQDALALAVFAALNEDREPADDPQVIRILTTSAIANQGVAQAVNAFAFDGFRAVCLEQLDPIVQAMRKPFNAAAKTLTDAHKRIGDVALTDTDSIMRMGNDVAEVWAKATAAVKVIEAADAAWQALATITRTSSNENRWRVLRIAEVNYAEWTSGEIAGKKLKPWDVVRAGLTLSLPTVAEYMERVTFIKAGDARVEMLEQQAGRAYASGKRPANQLLA